jgi:hypothetical protein
MHVGAVSLASTPLAAGGAGASLSGEVNIVISLAGALLIPSASVLWYESESIGIEFALPDIEIDVTPNVGITTE